ncbi:calsequestrin-2-like [Tropilaelaps mercedesae]|uniref:Calsequestrin n=1 Tax=Tropilaelaps mercedesae TaxID=418985 RepID=A0A1V9Y3L1_9ACAR|nr:calsequestrin-2-like [Tropilaelaps mercedesae]
MGVCTKRLATALVVLVAINEASASLFDFLVKSNNLDGVNRVQTLTSEQEIQSAALAVVFVTANVQASRESEMLAQILSTRTSPAAVYCAVTGVLKDSVEGQVLVFRAGRRYIYHGVREAALIFKFISHLENRNLKTITGKLDRVALDNTRGTKLIGYFALASPELQTFEQAAQLFGTQVSFFTVTDPIVAKHLKMNATGQIYLVREFDKHPVVCQVNPATLADIQQFIVFNRDLLIKVTPLNVLDPSLTSSSAILLVTDSSPFSFHLIKLIIRCQRLGGSLMPTPPASKTSPTMTSAALPVNKVLWLDAGDFPAFDAAAPAIHGLLKLPGLGFWNATKETVKWMDLLPLNNKPIDKIAEETNLLLVKAFLNAHLTIAPLPATLAEPAIQTKTEL